MSRPWVSKLLISPKLVLLTIRTTLPRVTLVVSAICSWVQLLQKDGGQALQKDGGQAMRFERMK